MKYVRKIRRDWPDTVTVVKAPVYAEFTHMITQSKNFDNIEISQGGRKGGLGEVSVKLSDIDRAKSPSRESVMQITPSMI